MHQHAQQATIFCLCQRHTNYETVSSPYDKQVSKPTPMLNVTLACS